MGRVVRATLPPGVVHLFVVYGYQGAEEDPDQRLLTDKLLQAVLADVQVVCIGQPMRIAGDLNADPALIPCLSKGISACRFVDLALAYSFGAGVKPDATCKFKREDCVGSRRDFIVGCPNALAASIGGSLLTFLYLLAFALMPGWLMMLARKYVSLSGLLVGWILLISPRRRLLVLFRMSGMFIGMSLGWFLMRLFLLLGMLPPNLL